MQHRHSVTTSREKYWTSCSIVLLANMQLGKRFRVCLVTSFICLWPCDQILLIKCSYRFWCLLLFYFLRNIYKSTRFKYLLLVTLLYLILWNRWITFYRISNINFCIKLWKRNAYVVFFLQYVISSFDLSSLSNFHKNSVKALTPNRISRLYENASFFLVLSLLWRFPTQYKFLRLCYLVTTCCRWYKPRNFSYFLHPNGKLCT